MYISLDKLERLDSALLILQLPCRYSKANSRPPKAIGPEPTTPALGSVLATDCSVFPGLPFILIAKIKNSFSKSFSSHSSVKHVACS